MTFPVRAATTDDWVGIWPIIQEVAAAEETFAMDARPDEAETRDSWTTPPPGRVVVAVDDRGQIVGTAAQGFRGIQFNAVVATNKGALGLYESEGFRTLGAAPGAFVHPSQGRVDLLIPWRDLP